jgi:uncharacterized protein YceK
MRKGFVPFALAIATLYLTLSVSSVTCLFAHGSRSGSAHHHTGGATQSSLCAWACDAHPTVDLPTPTPQPQPLQFLSMLLSSNSPITPFLSQQSGQSRAPPHS